MAGGSVVLIALALASVGPWAGQTRVLIVLLGWIAAVAAGGWAYRGRARGTRSGTRLLAALAVVALAGSMALLAISLQVRDILAGSVVFGTSGTGCEIGTEAIAFELSAPVRGVAFLERAVEPAETVSVVLVGAGTSTLIASETSDTSFDCLGATLTPADAGQYRLEVRADGEILATGSFEVLPAAR